MQHLKGVWATTEQETPQRPRAALAESNPHWERAQICTEDAETALAYWIVLKSSPSISRYLSSHHPQNASENMITSLLQIHKVAHVRCLHAVSSRQNPAARDKDSSANVPVRLLGVTWFLPHRHLPGYRPWTDLQTPVDSGKGLLWLRQATGLKL